MPKIGYLIDENASWDLAPSWKFYTENETPDYILRFDNGAGKVKRIVYWEIE
jgi:hypothetical protein